MGQGGSAPTGSGGSIVSGTGGNVVSGTGGNVVSGSGGSIVNGTGGVGGTTGVAGRNGTGGIIATGGRGGATGAGGSGGRGGATGAAGSGGRGGNGGAPGSAGRGGTTGTGGSGGRAGATGTAGNKGTGGTGGAAANSCPLGGKLTCTSAGSLKLTPDGQVVDFSAAQWNSTAASWCDAHGLDGGISSYAGMTSTAAAAVDTVAQNLKLNLKVTAGQWAGGRVDFDSCVDASGFGSLQFTGSVTAGSLTGCVWQVQLQTQDQRPSTMTNPTGGTCNATTTTCERYPAFTLTNATTVATTFTVPFTSFSNPATSAIATPSQIVGLQWQVNSGNSGSGTCTVELRIDGVRFVSP
jgi:hypothetical protein